MKKLFLHLLPLLPALILSAGCGVQTKPEVPRQGVAPDMADLTSITERTEYYDIFAESEIIFGDPPRTYTGSDQEHQDSLQEDDFDGILLGTQFAPEGPIQLRAMETAKGTDIYLCSPDGSRELLREGIFTYYANSYSPEGSQWYLDPEGNIYCWRNANYLPGHTDPSQKNLFDTSIAKILPSGQILYDITLDPGILIEDFCQLADGSIYLLLQDEPNKSRCLTELDSQTGRLSQINCPQIKNPFLAKQYLGTGGETLTLLNCETYYGYEILAIDVTDASSSTVLSFTGTSYSMSPSDHLDLSLDDFRVMEDGSIELLWLEPGKDSVVIYERLRMEKVEKETVIVRGLFKTDAWILSMASRFNQLNDTYHIILEDCGTKNNLDDFARLTSIQITAGKGPDILYGNLMHDYMDGLLDKGALEELNPYMEASGIREEDYFPFTFGVWRTGGSIYSVSPKMSITGYQMDAALLGNEPAPDVEALADALLSRQGNVLFLSGFSPQQVLEMFLSGTENLWDMVDWKTNTCNFCTPLFAKLLEAAKHSGDNGKKGGVSSIAERRNFSNILEFEDLAAQEQLGKVTCGIMFDDGCHGAADSGFAMAINSNSRSKAGAWEFILFLLGEEAQFSSEMPPVNKNLFEAWLEETKKHIEAVGGANIVVTKIVNGQVLSEETSSYAPADLTDTKIAEYRTLLEESRPYPYRTAPILSIILEEAADYFNDSKSADQVGRIITNRVQLFLDENN